MIVTGFYASLLALLLLTLAYRVICLRRQFKIGLLDEGNVTLRKAIRIHGNAVEYIPLTLILMACAELNNVSVLMLHCLGIAIVVLRVWHAVGLSRSQGVTKGRFYGTLGTWIIILTLVCVNILMFIKQQMPA